jgi:hypothetical protein
MRSSWQIWLKLRHCEDSDPQIQYEFQEHVLRLDQPRRLTIY